MSVFQQNLPIQIIPSLDNEEGIKYQGILEGMESDSMKIRMDDSFFQQPISNSISVEFTMSSYNFQFESDITKTDEASYIHIAKPKVIHKSQIRKSPRLRTKIPFHYTIWTEGGRFDGVITDISTVGIKITTLKQLKKNSLLSVNIYVPGELRIICQALVMWCKQNPEDEYYFVSGIKFTTLSIDSMKKVDKYIRDKISQTKILEE